MRLVKDTNVFVAALRSGSGASRELLRQLALGRHSPLMGDKLWYEYLDVVGRDGDLWANCGLSKARRRQAVEDFASLCEYVRVTRIWRPNLPDEGDNHIMELAIVGKASSLVTFNTKDFLHALFAPPALEVLTPGQFIENYP